ncbi:RAMP superfamily CRISPR-associated protein [Stappia sp.]|uniref:RAMP superfamily CRISPR-associated protein n=1 Tax=Stappia sp. TaxID=1870903 RepID=UPI003D118CED
MQRDWTILRVTLQSRSPLIIASGEDEAMSDTDPVRDANGLPMLPATSLAGALRARAGNTADDWFGWQVEDGGKRSSVAFTDGLFHWADDRPRDGLVLKPDDLAGMSGDDLCKAVLPGQRPLIRQHVRLNDKGTVDGDGKFSRDAVPTGARFTFEMRTDNRAAADALQGLIREGLFLGGATRSGYGETACVRLLREDLTLPADWSRWCAIFGGDLGQDRDMKESASATARGADPAGWVLSGRMEGPLLIGADGRNDGEDRAPWREPRIVWDGRKGRLDQEVFVIPGSAIKGPVRHRALYHLRKAKVADAQAVLNDMFGHAAKGGSGRAGRLRFHDVAIANAEVIAQTHVGLDRFSGGARRGVLFTDALLWRPRLEIRITKLGLLTSEMLRALEDSLSDLKAGRLGIGAEWGEGAGIFVPDQPLAEEVEDAA